MNLSKDLSKNIRSLCVFTQLYAIRIIFFRQAGLWRKMQREYDILYYKKHIFKQRSSEFPGVLT